MLELDGHERQQTDRRGDMTAVRVPQDCSDCPIAVQALAAQRETAAKLDALNRKIDGLTDAIARQDAAMQVHVARHLERESIQAQSIQWAKVTETLITWTVILALSMMVLFALTHSGAVLKFFGVN